MIRQFIRGRTAVFIDAANILYSQRSLGWRVDYQKLQIYFQKECDLQGMYLYTGRVGSNEKQTAFLQKIHNLGYILCTKEVKKIKLGNNTVEWKGNLDIELTIGVLDNIDNFDTLILMSGDSDFAPLLDRIKAEGKRVLVMSTKGHVAKELLNRAKYINLKMLKRQVAYE